MYVHQGEKVNGRAALVGWCPHYQKAPESTFSAVSSLFREEPGTRTSLNSALFSSQLNFGPSSLLTFLWWFNLLWDACLLALHIFINRYLLPMPTSELLWFYGDFLVLFVRTHRRALKEEEYRRFNNILFPSLFLPGGGIRTGPIWTSAFLHPDGLRTDSARLDQVGNRISSEPRRGWTECSFSFDCSLVPTESCFSLHCFHQTWHFEVPRGGIL